jgi:predicted helicase
LDTASASAYVFPLYINQEKNLMGNDSRIPNLNIDIVNQIADKLGLNFTEEKESTLNTFSPIDLLDYIYAILNSPKYRLDYNELLKDTFPKIPFPKIETFWKLVALGSELRSLHVFDNPILDNLITSYPISGNNHVFIKGGQQGSVKFEKGNVFINENQYFENISEDVFNLFIGGYQPAQKWIKDRNGSTLEIEEILHYQKMIVALTETDRIMKAIDLIGII